MTVSDRSSQGSVVDEQCHQLEICHFPSSNIIFSDLRGKASCLSVFYRLHFDELHQFIPPLSAFYHRTCRLMVGYHPSRRSKRILSSFIMRTANEWNSLCFRGHTTRVFKVQLNNHIVRICSTLDPLASGLGQVVKKKDLEIARIFDFSKILL